MKKKFAIAFLVFGTVGTSLFLTQGISSIPLISSSHIRVAQTSYVVYFYNRRYSRNVMYQSSHSSAASAQRTVNQIQSAVFGAYYIRRLAVATVW